MENQSERLPWRAERDFMDGTGHWAWYVRDSEGVTVCAFQINSSRPEGEAEKLARMCVAGSLAFIKGRGV